MNRMEFMRQLEVLLAEISPREKEEAIQYYNDYFDDAGAENEAEVIRALGTPAKVAETIKADLFGKNTEEWEFTESGCTNMGNKKNAVVTSRSDDGQNAYQQGNQYNRQYNNNPNGYGRNTEPKQDTGKMILIVLIVIVTSPFWLSLVGAIFGVVTAILGVLVALLFAFAICAVAFIISGIIIFGVSIAKLFISPILGLMMMGISLLLAGFGIFFMIITVWICGSVLPACFRGIINLCRKPLNRRGGQMA